MYQAPLLLLLQFHITIQATILFLLLLFRGTSVVDKLVPYQSIHHYLLLFSWMFPSGMIPTSAFGILSYHWFFHTKGFWLNPHLFTAHTVTTLSYGSHQQAMSEEDWYFSFLLLVSKPTKSKLFSYFGVVKSLSLSQTVTISSISILFNTYHCQYQNHQRIKALFIIFHTEDCCNKLLLFHAWTLFFRQHMIATVTVNQSINYF